MRNFIPPALLSVIFAASLLTGCSVRRQPSPQPPLSKKSAPLTEVVTPFGFDIGRMHIEPKEPEFPLDPQQRARSGIPENTGKMQNLGGITLTFTR